MEQRDVFQVVVKNDTDAVRIMLNICNELFLIRKRISVVICRMGVWISCMFCSCLSRVHKMQLRAPALHVYDPM